MGCTTFFGGFPDFYADNVFDFISVGVGAFAWYADVCDLAVF
jgi:hypothetical protein